MPGRPQEAQRNALDEVDRDDIENARRADLDDCFGFAVIERAAADDGFGFPGFAIFLSLDDTPGEDDIFEIEDRKVVIFQFFSGMKGYDVAQRPNPVSNSGDGRLRHPAILREPPQGSKFRVVEHRPAGIA